MPSNWYSWALPSGDRTVADKLDVTVNEPSATDEMEQPNVVTAGSRNRVVTNSAVFGDQSRRPTSQLIDNIGAGARARTEDLLITNSIRTHLARLHPT